MCRSIAFAVVIIFLSQRCLTTTADGKEKEKKLTKEEEENERLREARINISRTLDSILEGYDKTLRPSLHISPGVPGPSTEVAVDILVLNIGPVIEVDMEYKIDVFFRQRWNDNRLRFNGSDEDILRLNTVMLESIWYPDTYFLNGKSSKRHVITTPNALFRIKPNGHVLYTQRLTIVASCLMQLQKYPMDTQVCPLELGSNSYAIEDVQYKWNTEPNNSESIKVEKNARMAQYTLSQTFIAFKTVKVNDRIGNRSVLIAKFTFQRHVGFFLIQTYIPCVLIVILSWVSFFLNREATPARVALGIMAILTITTMGWSSRSVLPKVSYAKAVDWFNVLCFAFVFAALAEFAAVNYFTKRRAGNLPGMEDNEDEDDLAQAELVPQTTSQHTQTTEAESEHDSVEHYYQPVIRSEKVDAALRRKKRFTLLSSITRYNIKVKNTREADRPSLCTDFLNCVSGNPEYRERRMKRTRNDEKQFNSVSRIDEISRILFPISFVVINALFWFAYSV